MPWLADRAEQLGYRLPTPTQLLAVPAITAGQDVILQALTGSGKTLAYLLPTLSALDTDRPRDDVLPGVLIVVPSRELGVQITMLIYHLLGGNVSKRQPGDSGNMFRFAGPRALRVRGCLSTLEALQLRDPTTVRGTHVVVGTPEALALAVVEQLSREQVTEALLLDARED